MAMIERVSMCLAGQTASGGESDHGLSGAGLPGLRIGIRSRPTTSSMSDYHDWNVEELNQQYRDTLITDGSCS